MLFLIPDPGLGSLDTDLGTGKNSRRVRAKVPGRGLDKQIALWVPSGSQGRSKVAFPSAGSKHGRNLGTSPPVPHPRSQMESRAMSGHTFEYY